jgi:hypothetical protein
MKATNQWFQEKEKEEWGRGRSLEGRYEGEEGGSETREEGGSEGRREKRGSEGGGGRAEEEDMIAYLNFLEDELNILSQEDWYRVSLRQIEERGGLPGNTFSPSSLLLLSSIPPSSFYPVLPSSSCRCSTGLPVQPISSPLSIFFLPLSSFAFCSLLPPVTPLLKI